MPMPVNHRALAAKVVPTGDHPPPENMAAKGEVSRRRFGRTDVVVSALGLGGATFAGAQTKKVALQIVHEAIDNGITFMDNAWDYHDGKSEEWMGYALKGPRDQVFLMTKCCSHGRDKKSGDETTGGISAPPEDEDGSPRLVANSRGGLQD